MSDVLINVSLEEFIDETDAAQAALRKLRREALDAAQGLSVLQRRQESLAQATRRTQQATVMQAPLPVAVWWKNKAMSRRESLGGDPRRAALRAQQQANLRARLGAQGARIAGAAPPVPRRAGPPTAGPNLIETLEATGKEVAGPAAAVAGALALAAEKMGELGYAAAKFLLTQQAIRDAALTSFGGLFGGVERANQAFGRALVLSSRLGLSVSDTVGAFQLLGAQGFDPLKIEEWTKSFADLKTIVPASSSDKVLGAFAKLGKKQKLGAEDIQTELGDGAGINVNHVKDALGEMLGVKGKSEADIRANVDKQIAAGKVTGAQGVAAGQKAISRMSGGHRPGDAAQRASGSLAGVWAQLQTLPATLAMSVDLPGTEPIRAFGQTILDVLRVDGPVASALLGSVGKLFSAVSHALFDAAPGGDALSGIMLGVAGAVDALAAVVRVVAPVARAFVGGLVEGFSEVHRVLAPIASSFLEMWTGAVGDQGLELAQVARAIGKGLVYMAVAVGAVVAGLVAAAGMTTVFLGAVLAGVVGLVAFLANAGVQLASALWGWVTDAGAVGQAIVYGIVEGMLFGLPSLISTAVQLGASVIGAVGGELEIASPSKVMAEMGGHTAAGFALGVAGGAPAVDGAMADLVSPTGTAAGAATRSFGASAVNVTVNVDAPGGDAQTIGDHLRRILPAALRDAFDQMSTEMGVAT